MQVVQWAVLVLGSIAIGWVSWPALQDVHSHGFPRFFAWELILGLFTLNMPFWFAAPFGVRQLVSWGLLLVSLVMIFLGVRAFRRHGEVDARREEPALVGIEKTTNLVTTGIYRYIRHPFYSSLLFLAWGIYFKRFSWPGLGLAAAATLFLVLTAKREEQENISFFGQPYRVYMQTTRMFIPFLF
jgi:protein-S-isoprenylcysteine O-methyltransferase Ste14